MSISAIVPALILSAVLGAAAYWFEGEIDIFGTKAEGDLRAYVHSMPRTVTGLKGEITTAQRQVASATRHTAAEITLASREFQSVVHEERYRRALLYLHPSSSLKFALAIALSGFCIVYYRAARKAGSTQTRL